MISPGTFENHQDTQSLESSVGRGEILFDSFKGRSFLSTKAVVTPKVAAVDFETLYDKECSVKVLGNRGYIRHPRYEAYLVSIVCDDGFEFCGHPKDAPWSRISGEDWTWVSHNASFDTQVYVALADRGIISRKFYPAEWHCTSDLSAYLGSPRSLAGAIQFFYSIKPDKSPRDAMRGKKWEKVSDEFKARFIEYALDDSRYCLKLWQDFSGQWPEAERRISKFTRIKAWRGLFVDQERVQRGIDHLALLAWAAEQKIPWMQEGGKALSYPCLVEECKKAGIWCPPSVAMNSDDCAAWEDEFGSRFQWIAAMRLKRRANALLTKLRTLQRKIGPDGRMEYSMKYFGAALTGRWSGDGLYNVQNLTRREMFGVDWWEEEGRALVGDLIDGPGQGVEEWGVDTRKCFIPPPGFQFNPADLAQIEPRCCAPGTLVLTDSGYKCIEDLSLLDKVWDGCEFVNHMGVVAKLGTPGIQIFGEGYTNDHKIYYSETEYERAEKVLANSGGADKARDFRAANWKDLWALAYFVGTEMLSVGKVLMQSAMSFLWERIPSRNFGFKKRKINSMQ